MLNKCEICGKEFEANRGAKYCSNACRQKKYVAGHREKCREIVRKWRADQLKKGLKYWRNQKYQPSRKKAQEIRQLREKQARIVMKLLLGGRCEDCGYDRFIDVLEIHHLNMTKDKGKTSLKEVRIWLKTRILPEKTKLLCPTCHEEKHRCDFS